MRKVTYKIAFMETTNYADALATGLPFETVLTPIDERTEKQKAEAKARCEKIKAIYKRAKSKGDN